MTGSREYLQALMDEPLTGKVRTLKRTNTGPKAGGYADTPGTGPQDQTCGSCKHLFRVQLSNTYLKCNLMRPHLTGGGATDVRARSPACRLWEAKTC